MTQAAMVALDYGVSSYLNQLEAHLLHLLQMLEHKVVVPVAILPFLACPLRVLLAPRILLALQTPQPPMVTILLGQLTTTRDSVP
jgi:hypothetical protein